MPSRFFDHDSDFFRSSRKKEDKVKTGLRQPRESNKARRISTAEPASATSTASSSFSTAGKRHGHQPSRSMGFLETIGQQDHKVVKQERQIEPTAQVQEWAHQMHIQQRREYWWCTACHPKAPTLQIPTQKTMKRVRIAEPTHAYE